MVQNDIRGRIDFLPEETLKERLKKEELWE